MSVSSLGPELCHHVRGQGLVSAGWVVSGSLCCVFRFSHFRRRENQYLPRRLNVFKDERQFQKVLRI